MEILGKIYPQQIEVEDPFRVLIQVMLSHQTADTVSFPAAERLFQLADSPEKIVNIPTKKIARTIFPVGFYNTKARNIRTTCRILLDKYDGEVPNTKDELVELPGVGLKSASIVLAYGFGIPTIAVDTHVNRISQRLGWVKKGTKPEKTQEVIEKLIPRSYHLALNHVLVEFGRDICQSRRPQCYRCPIYRFCRYERKSYFRKNA
jgi:endonuclease-3